LNYVCQIHSDSLLFYIEQAACHERSGVVFANWRAFMGATSSERPWLHNDIAGCPAHLAILREPYLAQVLLGEKTIESRFARVRAAPYGRVALGDLIWLKRAGGPIAGVARAAEVRQFADLTPERVDALLDQFADALRLGEDFAARARRGRYATLIWLDHVRALTPPLPYPRRDRRGWVILEPGWSPK
jgi:hypothetical protein